MKSTDDHPLVVVPEVRPMVQRPTVHVITTVDLSSRDPANAAITQIHVPGTPCTPPRRDSSGRCRLEDQTHCSWLLFLCFVLAGY